MDEPDGLEPSEAPASPESETDARQTLWRKPKVIAVVCAVVVLVGAGVGYSVTRDSQNTIGIGGNMTLTDTSASWTIGDPCSGTGGYSDMVEGAPVTVKNEKGAIIATGGLLAGFAIGSTKCDFFFAVRSVPAAKFYSLEISHRGSITEPASQIDKKKQTLLFSSMTLGSS